MHAHLTAQDDDMWYITDGPIIIMKINTVVTISDETLQKIENPRDEQTIEDKKKSNLDNVANDILYKNLDINTLPK